MRAYGPQAFTILFNLLCTIYGDEGYYMRWDDDACFLIADDIGVKEVTVSDVVDKAVQVNFFDGNMFENKSILTSKGIQERYKLVTKRSSNTIKPEYDLAINAAKTIVNVTETGVNVTKTQVNAAKTPQSKVNETKPNNKKNSASDDGTTFFESDFDEIWEEYPNKKGKKAAFNHYRAWRKKSVKHTNQYLFERLRLYKLDLEAKKDWLRPMNGSTWFNGRFDDTYDSEQQEEEQANRNWFGD